ncbi:hypothetical protein [Burkholderia ubonensis]|uniref:hypothetical protein n=1 Tax=Burkholderia ubonensis TaxID=101571 RepID=UPI0012F70FE0|nr:hypothetical protein [Burkholderia ubonensis]
MTNAIIIKKNVLPGFDLMQSQQDAQGWPKGAYGLVEINDPTVVFPGPLLKDPTAGMSDDELNALPEMPAGSDEFDQAAEALGEKLILEAVTGHRLVQACIERGYKPTEDGFLHFWLLQYLATQVDIQSEPSAS